MQKLEDCAKRKINNKLKNFNINNYIVFLNRNQLIYETEN